MFSRPKILFLVSLLFVALLNSKFNPYLLFKFLIFYHSSLVLCNNKNFLKLSHRYPIEELAQYEFSKVAIIFSINN